MTTDLADKKTCAIINSLSDFQSYHTTPGRTDTDSSFPQGGITFGHRPQPCMTILEKFPLGFKILDWSELF